MTETTAFNGNDIEYATGAAPARGNDQRIIGYKLYFPESNDDSVRYTVGNTYEIQDFYSGEEFWVGSLLDMLRFWVCDTDLLKWDVTGKSNKNVVHFFEVSVNKNDAFDYTPDKKVARRFLIEREFSFQEFVRAAIKRSGWDHSRVVMCGTKNAFVSSKDDAVLNGGNVEIMAACGKRAQFEAYGARSAPSIFAIGDDAVITAHGNETTLIASGLRSRLDLLGGFCSVVADGDFNQLTVKGDNNKIKVGGDSAKITTFGDRCVCKTTGQKSFIDIKGRFGSFQGGEGALVQIADYNSAHERQDDLFARIGENNVKPDTLYTTQNGRFIEVEAGNE